MAEQAAEGREDGLPRVECGREDGLSGGRRGRGRVHFIDEVRGGDILLVVIFHGFYTLGWLLEMPVGERLFMFFRPAQAFFAGIFVFLCGFSSRLSKSNVRRGVTLAGVAAGITGVMWLLGVWDVMHEAIWFGILHLLAVCILLFAALRPVLDRIPPWVGLCGCALLFALLWNVMPESWPRVMGIPGVWSVALPESLTGNVWLYPLGLGAVPRGGASDYFPLLPWVFCFLGGSFMGVWAQRESLPRWMYPSRVPALSWLGKHTLIIYIAHQPVIYGVGMGVLWVVNAVKG